MIRKYVINKNKVILLALMWISAGYAVILLPEDDYMSPGYAPDKNHEMRIMDESKEMPPKLQRSQKSFIKANTNNVYPRD